MDETAPQETSSPGHDHTSGHDHARDAPKKALWVAIILNATFLLVEVAVGWWANSLALLSDAGHMVSDVASLTLALVAAHLAESDVRGDYTFGLQRVPVLGALINAATLIVVVVLILREAVVRLSHPPEVAGMPVLIAGVIGLIVNVVSALYLHKMGGESVNVRGAFLHLVADALGSVAAIGSALVILWTGWAPIDPILSLLIGVLIVYSTWPLLTETVNIILQRAPGEVDIEELQGSMLSHGSVERIDDIHIWQLDSQHLVLSAILVADGPMGLVETNRTADQIRQQLHDEFGIVHTTLEWRDPDHPAAGCHNDYEVELFRHPDP